jgi:hypothetical protein
MYIYIYFEKLAGAQLCQAASGIFIYSGKSKLTKTLTKPNTYKSKLTKTLTCSVFAV